MPIDLNGAGPAESSAERQERLTGQIVGPALCGTFLLAILGIWVITLTPASVTMAIRIGQLAPDRKAEVLAFVASAGAAAAFLANPVFGALSDSSTLRWGQRRPFILAGAALAAVGVIVMGFATSVSMLSIGWIVAQLSTNSATAALFAILPERIPDRLRGRVAAFMGMAPQVGILLGTLITKLVGTDGAAMFAVPAALGVLLVLPLLLTMRERARSRNDVRPIRPSTILGAYWINPLRYRDFALAWASRFFVWTAYYLLVNFKTYFLIDRLGFTTANVAGVLSKAMAILTATIVLSSLAGGWLSDYFDRRRTFIVAASIICSFTMVYVATATTLWQFYVAIAFSGLAYGLYLGVDYALVARVLPDSDSEAAKGMAIFNLSSTLPQTLAPAMGPALLAVSAFGHGGTSSGNYVSLFVAAASLALLGGGVARCIRTR